MIVAHESEDFGLSSICHNIAFRYSCFQNKSTKIPEQGEKYDPVLS